LIVSLAEEALVARAWRIVVPFIGSRDAIEVGLDVLEDGSVVSIPTVPWALSVGNVVQVSYVRYGHAIDRTIQVEITGHDDAFTVVHMATQKKIDPKQLPIDRIRGAFVVTESNRARRLRRRMAILTQQAAADIAHGDFRNVAQILAAVSIAFPTTLNHDKPGGK
jgi:hypothetical protein